MSQKKSKVNFECQQDCPFPYDQDSKSIKFVERSWNSTVDENNNLVPGRVRKKVLKNYLKKSKKITFAEFSTKFF